MYREKWQSTAKGISISIATMGSLVFYNVCATCSHLAQWNWGDEEIETSYK